MTKPDSAGQKHSLMAATGAAGLLASRRGRRRRASRKHDDGNARNLRPQPRGTGKHSVPTWLKGILSPGEVWRETCEG